MGVVVYRVISANLEEPTLAWHHLAKLHIDDHCAYRRMHRRSRMIRQVFEVADVPDTMWCKNCAYKDRHQRFAMWWHRWAAPEDGMTLRTQYLRRMQKRWAQVFTREFSVALSPCDRERPGIVWRAG